jgi:hypothetical protein
MVCRGCGYCTGYGKSCCNEKPGRPRGVPCGCGAGDSGCSKCGLCKKCGSPGAWYDDVAQAIGRRPFVSLSRWRFPHITPHTHHTTPPLPPPPPPCLPRRRCCVMVDPAVMVAGVVRLHRAHDMLVLLRCAPVIQRSCVPCLELACLCCSRHCSGADGAAAPAPALAHRFPTSGVCNVCVTCGNCTGFGATCVRHKADRPRGVPCGCGMGKSGCEECKSCETCCASNPWYGCFLPVRRRLLGYFSR